MLQKAANSVEDALLLQDQGILMNFGDRSRDLRFIGFSCYHASGLSVEMLRGMLLSGCQGGYV